MNSETINHSLGTLKEVLSRHAKPVVLCSFGKDSIAMLHLVMATGARPDVIFFRDPWQPGRIEFAESVIREWKLRCFDWPPQLLGIRRENGVFQTVSRYHLNNNFYIDLPKDYLEPDPKDFVCALEDVMHRPRSAGLLHKWDLLLIGHKNTDADDFCGKIPLLVDVRHGIEGEPTLCFPIRQWTDDDVWDYTIENTVPFDQKRYDLATRSEFMHRQLNSDYLSACKRCIDPSEPYTVFCPKLNREVNNVSSRLRVLDHRSEWIGPKEAAS